MSLVGVAHVALLFVFSVCCLLFVVVVVVAVVVVVVGGGGGGGGGCCCCCCCCGCCAMGIYFLHVYSCFDWSDRWFPRTHFAFMASPFYTCVFSL